MFLICGLLLLMAALVLVQMMVPRQSLTALGAFAAGGAGLYGAFSTSALVGLIATGGVVLIVPLTVYLSLRLMAPYEPELRPVDPNEPTAALQPEQLAQLVGVNGVSQTPLDPAGVVFLMGHRVRALCETGSLPQGAAVVVAKVEGARVVVKAKG